MAFTMFNRQGHKTLSDEIAKELDALGQRLGLKFNVGGGTIGQTDLTIKVVATSNDPAIAEANAKRELDMYGRYYGLEGCDYGTTFGGSRGQYKLTGVSPNRPKYPIDGVCLRTGKMFKFTQSVCKEIIAKRQASPTPTASAPTQLSPSSNASSNGAYADAAIF